jgi:hypothetical protein
LDRDDFGQLDCRPWVLAGKIYERFGLTGAAANAFHAARAAPAKTELAAWAGLLAFESSKTAGK